MSWAAHYIESGSYTWFFLNCYCSGITHVVMLCFCTFFFLKGVNQFSLVLSSSIVLSLWSISKILFCFACLWQEHTWDMYRHNSLLSTRSVLEMMTTLGVCWWFLWLVEQMGLTLFWQFQCGTLQSIPHLSVFWSTDLHRLSVRLPIIANLHVLCLAWLHPKRHLVLPHCVTFHSNSR